MEKLDVMSQKSAILSMDRKASLDTDEVENTYSYSYESYNFEP